MWIFKGKKIEKSEKSEEKSYGFNFLKLIGLRTAHYIVSSALVMVSKEKKNLKMVVVVSLSLKKKKVYLIKNNFHYLSSSLTPCASRE